VKIRALECEARGKDEKYNNALNARHEERIRRRRWDRNTEIDLKEVSIKDADCIYPAPDRIQL
jgi:hypothetical protein